MSEIAGSKKAQRELQNHKREKEEQIDRDLKWVMGQPVGRRFIFDLIDRRCILFSASYTGNSDTYLREGQRKVAIDLTKDIQRVAKGEYVQMISEAFELKKRDDLVEVVAQQVAQEEDQS